MTSISPANDLPEPAGDASRTRSPGTVPLDGSEGVQRGRILPARNGTGEGPGTRELQNSKTGEGREQAPPIRRSSRYFTGKNPPRNRSVIRNSGPYRPVTNGRCRNGGLPLPNHTVTRIPPSHPPPFPVFRIVFFLTTDSWKPASGTARHAPLRLSGALHGSQTVLRGNIFGIKCPTHSKLFKT